MARLLDFAARFGTEERCIEHLAGLRWPGGFVCSGCRGRVAWRLKDRPRVYECGTCHRQESVTAGTVFHRTRTDLLGVPIRLPAVRARGSQGGRLPKPSGRVRTRLVWGFSCQVVVLGF